jgi:hypothetical protein
MTQFDSKIFNGEVFGSYVKTIPSTKRLELIRSKAIVSDQSIASMFDEQTGGNYATIPFKGRIGKSTKNYDGDTDITANTSETYSQGVVVVGRADAWTEKDFSYEITGGVDFMDSVAQQIAEYWEGVDQDTILAILEGIFNMTGDFATKHTYDISALEGDACKVGQTTLNSAIQKACGDNKKIFALALMHSTVSTNLENLNLIANLKYTDADGIQRDLQLGTWNGRLVIVDDDMPYDEATGKYTTYVLGVGAIVETDCGVKVPYEMSRDPKTNGGKDTLYSRQRKIYKPQGISFTKNTMAKLSPTEDELKLGANWELVNNGKTGEDKKYISDKAVAIARIISKEDETLVPSV